jgi:hypothetical protein
MKKVIFAVMALVLASAVSALAAGKTLLIDNCDGGNSINAIGGIWCTYDDSKSGGKSVVWPPAASTTGNLFTMSAPGFDGSGFAARMTGVAGSTLKWDFIGMLCTLGTDASCPTCKGIDVGNYTGVQFMLKGSITKGQLIFSLPYESASCDDKSGACVSLTDYADYQTDITSKLTSDWTLVKLDFAKDFAQPDWTKTEKKAALSDVLKSLHMLKWEYKSGDGQPVDVMVDNIELY